MNTLQKIFLSLIVILGFLIAGKLTQAKLNLSSILDCTAAIERCNADYQNCQRKITETREKCWKEKDKRMTSCNRKKERDEKNYSKCIEKAQIKENSCQKYSGDKKENCVNKAREARERCEEKRADAQRKYSDCVASANERFNVCEQKKKEQQAKNLARCAEKLQKCKEKVEKKCGIKF